MTKLNGWKRIGIIASVVWILVAGIYAYQLEFKSNLDLANFVYASCLRDAADKTGDTWATADGECGKKLIDSFGSAGPDARVMAELVAFVPVPRGWGLVYLVLFLVRRVKRGFMRPL